MLKVKKAIVSSLVSPNQDGSFWAKVDGLNVRVAYTSPSYNSNQGGIFASPMIDQEILVFEDLNPKDNKPDYFYVGSIVDDAPLPKDEKIPEFKGVRVAGDGSAYNKDNEPVKMALQNSDGQGISTISDLSNEKRINHVSLDAETGAYLTTGEQGCQVVNEHLDGIVVQGEPNGLFPGRSITMATDGPQFQESNASLNMTVGQAGDDINICNLANTPDLGGGGVTAGNVRIHSKNKDIILRTGAPGAVSNENATRNINIITPKAQIQINGQTGDISIQSNEGNVNVQGSTGINMTAPNITLNGDTVINGNLTATTGAASMSVGAGGMSVDGGSASFRSGAFSVNAGTVSIVGATPPAISHPAAATPPSPVPYTLNTVIPPTPTAPSQPVPIQIEPNSYGDAPDPPN